MTIDQAVVCTRPAGTGPQTERSLTLAVDSYRLTATLDPAPPASGRVTVQLSHRGRVVGRGVVDDRFFGFDDLGPRMGAVCLSRLGGRGMSGLVEEGNGFAHATAVVEDIFPGPSGAYAMKTFTWSNGDTPTLEYWRGGLVFDGFDPRMAYLWSAYAFSGFPVEVQADRAGHLVDVTNQYPALVRVDASQSWSRARSTQTVQAEEQDGAYAGWAADECRLEPEALVWHSLNELAKEGAFSTVVPARTFVTQLERTLVQDGYCPAP